MNLYSVKMRASRKIEDEFDGILEEGKKREQHISGAEKIIPEERLEIVCGQLLERALHHAKGEADFINLKIEKVKKEEVIIMDALPVTTYDVETAKEGREKLGELLKKSGILNGQEIVEKMKDTYGMRGAMLLDVDTMERLEPDYNRGIRATYMDAADNEDDRTQKNHFREAIVLATKVANHKNIIGEICISDDPDYVTGYFASKELGYIRVTKLKEMGCPDGGRIFLFRGTKEEVKECIEYLEKQKILVRI